MRVYTFNFIFLFNYSSIAKLIIKNVNVSRDLKSVAKKSIFLPMKYLLMKWILAHRHN